MIGWHVAGALSLLLLTAAAWVAPKAATLDLAISRRVLLMQAGDTDAALWVAPMPNALPPSAELRNAEADEHLRESIAAFEREVREWRAGQRGR